MSRKVLDRPVRSFAVASAWSRWRPRCRPRRLRKTSAADRIGIGGVERWIAYPVLLWMVVFGTALMGKTPPEA